MSVEKKNDGQSNSDAHQEMIFDLEKGILPSNPAFDQSPQKNASYERNGGLIDSNFYKPMPDMPHKPVESLAHPADHSTSKEIKFFGPEF